MEYRVINILRAYNRRKPGESKGTKSEASRRFAVEPNLRPLLDAMREERGGKGLIIDLASERAMARNFRRWLWKAGVRRPALHETTGQSQNITWHDLRATGATWMAVRGDDPLKIMQRCGHRDYATTQRYVREAEAIREGFGEPFPATALLSARAFQAAASWHAGGTSRLGQRKRSFFSSNLSGVDGTRTRGTEQGQVLDTAGVSPGTHLEADRETPRTSQGLEASSLGFADRNAEPTDAEMERGILDAVRLGLSDVARTLSTRLDDRRRARLPANVIEIDDGRRRRL